MCRWIAYFGNPIRPRTLLYDTEHGLVEQSRHDRLAGGFPNADGFGLGWYDEDGTASEPGLYRNTLPAWGDRNLHDLASHIRSPLFLGHVRAATGTPVESRTATPSASATGCFSTTASSTSTSRSATSCSSRSTRRCFHRSMGPPIRSPCSSSP